ncbi:hypothetical protein FRB95_000379 [Tulasnella sp. JGI-2019a]|nr:hypothetical protein FRB95_000379 [Tulasnella sp. JGI-2019a]
MQTYTSLTTHTRRTRINNHRKNPHPHLPLPLSHFCPSFVLDKMQFEGSSGWRDGRQISVRGKVYTSGAVTAEVTTHSKQLLHACRGGAVAIGLDKAGRELWSAVLEGKLAGSSTGPFYPNKITKEVFVTIDSAVAPLTTRVDLHYEFEWSTLHERGRQWHEIIQRARSAQNKERDSL